MQKSTQLSRLKDLEKKIVTHGNSAYVEVTPEELQAVAEANRPAEKAPNPAGPAPGHFDSGEEPQRALEEYIPPPDPDAPLSDVERRYAHHPDLNSIIAENPEEVPERVKARADRLLEVRGEHERPNPYSWMGF